MAQNSCARIVDLNGAGNFLQVERQIGGVSTEPIQWVRIFRWRRKRWRWSSKNRGIYWPDSIPHPIQNTSPATKFRQKKTGGERGIRTPQNPANNNGNPHDDAQIDSQFPVASSPDLSQVVTAWAKLPAPLKAAILAIVKTAE